MARNTSPTLHPATYSLAQIVLHWSIAALVIWELFFSEHPPRSSLGASGDLWSRSVEWSHVWLGLAVLALVLARIVLRLTQGAPAIEESHRFQAMAARVVHLLFYVMLVFMPITGVLAYYLGLPTGDLHELGEPVFIVLIAVHVAASLWHQFVRRDGLIRRMLVPAH